MLKHIRRKDFPMVLAAVLFALSFGFGIAVNSIAFSIFISICLVYTGIDIFRRNISFSWKEIIFLGITYFLWIAIREYSIDPGLSAAILGQNIALFLIPLLFGFQLKRIRPYVKIILWAFLVGCLCNAYLNLLYAIYRGFLTNENGINFWYFTYEHLAEPFSFQPIYLAFFFVFSLLILNQFDELRKHRIFYFSSIAILGLSVILLAARNAIVCMLILVPVFMVVKGTFSWKRILAIFGILGISFAIAIQNPVVRNRILKVNKKGNFFSGSSLRANIWESAFSAGKGNYILGSGEKSGNELLVEQYKTRKLLTPVKYKYHAHSLYFQTVIQYGLIGLILLASMLLRHCVIAIKHKNYLLLFWLLLFSITAITESVFNRQWGILSFVYLTSLLILLYDSTKKEQIESSSID